jgi:hypothetical protein
MAHPVTGPEILAALASNADVIAGYYLARPDHDLLTGDTDHWGPAHHLVHLTMTSRAIARGLRSELPLHPTGRSRGYAELIGVTVASVGAVPREQMLERGRVVVVPAGSSKAELVAEFRAASADLRDAAEGWRDEELDRRALTHPIVGVMTAREMLLFCVFHERHHLKLVRARLETDG